ncbi:hypothetical protein P153DRAFT_114768 [Dothidotthia symphoricarpi CBS 119687]|uniref:Uncharacterized protein n=1 Tax=Dothidotthia symphoricarpi CBS 119687 TaxID=1392245 RepID=A0A6A6A2V6_9PLEO|nr:uncharacterized protein P153DRAFT_114768 [Dothidotthia symphoricarpi CBS 119687]KAF2125505.1 hypothetical protein P153DRAFT_114768 [Dothidotthia symphoricarpi CBS 119687]
MLFSVFSIAALAIPVIAQSTTADPAATITSNGISGPPWATSNPEWSSIYNSLVSDGKIPSTLTAAPWPTTGYGPGRGPWGGNWGPQASGGQWGGPSGYGPWGSGSVPWSEWSTNSAWRSAPWTAWWNDASVCPPSEWPGWTAGSWSTDAPWTTWSGCTASTTATSVVTTTMSGSVVVTTAYGLQVAAASAVTTGGSTGGVPMKTAGLGVAIGAAVLGVVGGL